MSYLKFTIIVFISIILQLSIAEQFINELYYINLPLLIVIFYNWLSPNRAMLLFSVFIGWGQSYFDALPFGITILLFVITASLIQKISLTYLTNKTYGSLVTSGILGSLIYIGLLTLVSVAQYGITLDHILSYVITTQALTINIIFTVILLVLFKLFIFRNEAPQT